MATQWQVHPGGFHHLKSILRVGCWNVCSLVEADGGVKTATVRAGPSFVAVDKKVRFLVRELMHFRMGITCISETKWFGKDVYEINGYIVLHSGHDLPGSGDALQCDEGVAIVLDAVLSVAWRDTGEVWTAVNSRLVSARLQLCLGGSGCASSKLNVTVISVYVPIHGAPSKVKERFYDDLQAVNRFSSFKRCLVNHGDFNA